MDALKITSRQNPKVKQAVRLKERRERDESDLFLIEGFRELTRALVGGVEIEALFFCPELFLGTSEGALIKKVSQKGATLFETTSGVFDLLSYRDRPDGLVAIGRQRHLMLTDLTITPAALFVVVEAIEKPGNLGTILRSADAAGVHAVIVCDRCTDIYNPNVVRSSVGTLFTLPIVEASSEDAMAYLQRHKVKIVAATPEATARYTQVDLCVAVAIAVGTEQYGLSERWRTHSDEKVSIPMHGVADSLNVAVATSLLLYEVIRQRHASSL